MLYFRKAGHTYYVWYDQIWAYILINLGQFEYETLEKACGFKVFGERKQQKKFKKGTACVYRNVCLKYYLI